MTAALTIGPDGVARIEIVLRLDIVLKTEGAHALETAEQAGGVVGDPAMRDRGAPVSPQGVDSDGTEDRGADDPADAVRSDADAGPVDVQSDPVPPLPPTDPEPQPAAEAGGEPIYGFIRWPSRSR